MQSRVSSLAEMVGDLDEHRSETSLHVKSCIVWLNLYGAVNSKSDVMVEERVMRGSGRAIWMGSRVLCAATFRR